MSGWYQAFPNPLSLFLDWKLTCHWRQRGQRATRLNLLSWEDQSVQHFEWNEWQQVSIWFFWSESIGPKHMPQSSETGASLTMPMPGTGTPRDNFRVITCMNDQDFIPATLSSHVRNLSPTFVHGTERCWPPCLATARIAKKQLLNTMFLGFMLCLQTGQWAVVWDMLNVPNLLLQHTSRPFALHWELLHTPSRTSPLEQAVHTSPYSFHDPSVRALLLNTSTVMKLLFPPSSRPPLALIAKSTDE